MQIKSIVAGAVIALAAATSPASAGDEFSTLGGVSAESLSSVEMAAVVGADLTISITPTPGGGVAFVVLGTDAPLNGLENAESMSGGVVEVTPPGPTCPPFCGR